MTSTTPSKTKARLLLEILIVLSPLPVMKSLSSAGVLDSWGLETVSNFAGPIGTFMILIAATIALRVSGETWRDMGLRRPKRLWMIPVLTVGALVASFLLAGAAAFVLETQFGITRPNISVFDYLKGNFQALLVWLMISWVIGGLAEELSFRGFVLNRFAAFFGSSSLAFALAVVVQAFIFGAAHAYQGPAGMVATGTVGLVMGIFYLIGRRNLWPIMIAHGLIDTISFTAIYFGATSGGG